MIWNLVVSLVALSGIAAGGGLMLWVAHFLVEQDIPHLCDEDEEAPHPYRGAPTDWSERPCDLCVHCPYDNRAVTAFMGRMNGMIQDRQSIRPAPTPASPPPVRRFG